MSREKVILDVDTGSDDAVAIVCALLCKEIELLGITTVGGNVELKNTTENTLRVLDLCGRTNSVEVHMGCELPLASTLVPWGIQGLTLPHYENESDTSAKVHPDHLPLPLSKGNISEPRAAVWLVQKLMSMPDHSVTLVPVGPLTNIALAIRADDRILRKISRVVMMGGTHDTYAPTQGSEFNIWVDPEAAEILLSSGLDITMVSLDATSSAVLSLEQAQKIRQIGTAPAVFVADMIESRLLASNTTLGESDGKIVGAALHDPLAVCSVVHPEVLTDVWNTSCHIDLGRGYAYGETVLGRNYMTFKDEHDRIVDLPKNCKFARKADPDLFFEWLYDILKHKGGND